MSNGININLELKLPWDLYCRIRDWADSEFGNECTVEEAILGILDCYIWELEDVV